MRYDVVLFDLFGTLVHFVPEVPVVRVAGERRASVARWLEAPVQRELPEIPFSEFLEALAAETERIVSERPPEYREIPSEERFRRTLLRLGVFPARALEKAEALCRAHMAHLAARTTLPSGHLEVLHAVHGRCRTALVSNFDHGPTGRTIVERHGLARYLDAVVISADVGRRKPHPAIFREALARLGGEPQAVLHVGGSYADDVRGALAAGIDVAWIRGGASDPASGPAPTYQLSRLEDLLDVLD